MSTACGRPQGGPAHVDACGQGGGGSKTWFFCGRYKWMTPYRRYLETLLSYGHGAKTSQFVYIRLLGKRIGRQTATRIHEQKAQYKIIIMQFTRIDGSQEHLIYFGIILQRRCQSYWKCQSKRWQCRECWLQDSKCLGIHSDLFFKDRFFPNNVNIKICLVRNKGAFCLMSSAAGAALKVRILECKLYVR